MLLFKLTVFLLQGCGRKNGELSLEDYAVEENQRDNKVVYPYIVHTESSTWYLAKDDINILLQRAENMWGLE